MNSYNRLCSKTDHNDDERSTLNAEIDVAKRSEKYNKEDLKGNIHFDPSDTPYLITNTLARLHLMLWS